MSALSRQTRRAVAAAKAELEKVKADWLKRPGVVAIDVGHRITAGKTTDDVAIRVHVRRKLPEALLPPEDILPKRLGAFRVDVIEAHLAGPLK